jgi:tetrahydrodipicolinate N-succinyltransferase
MKKYELTTDTIQILGGTTLFRIKALIDIGNDGVKAGDLGGYIEKEDNLSHAGNAWVADDARVYDNAQVSGNAVVYDNARVFGNAKVYSNARVFGNAKVYSNARVCGNAQVHGNARV